MKPWKHSLCRLTGALIAAAAMSLPAAAQELSFYYPVAVGGPVTRIIDEMAADFEKRTPASRSSRCTPAATRTP
jgi:sn-glycerol 3-phosphate transport system substrate-binding protein